jgi:hypothetical protein
MADVNNAARPVRVPLAADQLTDRHHGWIAGFIGIDPRQARGRVAATSRGPMIAQADPVTPSEAAAPKVAGPKATGNPVSAPPKPKPPSDETQSDTKYKEWFKAHPKARQERVGPWLGEPNYKIFTKEYFLSKGFVSAGKMIMDHSSGGYDEIWRKDAGDGVEYRVYREPPAAKKPPPEPDETYDPDENADEDVIDAERFLKERGEERAKVLANLHELVGHIGQGDFEEFRAKYIAMEVAWEQHLREDQNTIKDYLDNSPSDDSKPELEDVSEALSKMFLEFPYGDDWKDRMQIPSRRGDPIKINPPKTVTGDHPITM